MADTPEDANTEVDDTKPAQPNRKDKGTVVSTAFGEKMSGGIADIADGDDE